MAMTYGALKMDEYEHAVWILPVSGKKSHCYKNMDIKKMLRTLLKA